MTLHAPVTFDPFSQKFFRPVGGIARLTPESDEPLRPECIRGERLRTFAARAEQAFCIED